MRLLTFTLCSTLSLTLPAGDIAPLPETDNTPALTQLMNSRTFKGLSVCTADPWKGLEYTKNLELDYLQWALTAAQAQEQQTLQKEIAEFILRTGRELQAVREKCLAATTTTKETEPAMVPKPKSGILGRDKDSDGSH